MVVLTLFTSKSVCDEDGVHPAATLMFTKDVAPALYTFSFAITLTVSSTNERLMICFILLFIETLFFLS